MLCTILILQHACSHKAYSWVRINKVSSMNLNMLSHTFFCCWNLLHCCGLSWFLYSFPQLVGTVESRFFLCVFLPMYNHCGFFLASEQFVESFLHWKNIKKIIIIYLNKTLEDNTFYYFYTNITLNKTNWDNMIYTKKCSQIMISWVKNRWTNMSFHDLIWFISIIIQKQLGKEE